MKAGQGRLKTLQLSVAWRHDAVRKVGERSVFSECNSGKAFDFLTALFFYQWVVTVLVTFANHARSRASSNTSRVEKYFVPFAGEFPSGFNNRPATITGMS